MIEPTLLFCILMILYFAFRVNRMEMRLNVIEKALNDAVRDGKLDTEYIGKPFSGDANGIGDFLRAVKDAWDGNTRK